jgi:preprotein translocase subunit SecF
MPDIIGKRYWYFLLSLLVIVPGIISMGVYWAQTGQFLRPSIDFTGGTLMELQFTGPLPMPAQVQTTLARYGLTDTMVQTSGIDRILIRSKFIDPNTKTQIQSDFRAEFGDFKELRFETVGPAVGAEVTQRGQFAVLLAALGIMLYLTWAFRQVPNAFRYGVCAIIAMFHDVFVVLGIESILGFVLGWEVDALFLTALLTVIGFSVHDTIVVFDRIRENLNRLRGESFESIVNHSIIQTLDRSINTQLTVFFTLLALALFGGVTIKHFVVILLIGIVSGTYSSIFNASPLLVVWENDEIGRFFRGLRRRPAAA